MELLAFALVTAARRLRAYFQAHTIVVLTDQPLRTVLHKPETSGRLVKWSIELSQFDIRYKPRSAIKGQAAADFIAELTPAIDSEDEDSEQVWTLNVDGSSTEETSGAGVILVSPEGHRIEYALRFQFPATNNEAEYEALVAGLRIARRMGADQLIVRSDSQLVIEQAKGEYEARGESMMEYCQLVKNLAKKFSKISFERIPRQENEEADRLARIASSREKNSEVPMELLESPSIGGSEVEQIEVEAEWAKSIKEYLEKGILPKDQNERRRTQY